MSSLNRRRQLVQVVVLTLILSGLISGMPGTSSICHGQGTRFQGQRGPAGRGGAQLPGADLPGGGRNNAPGQGPNRATAPPTIPVPAVDLDAVPIDTSALARYVPATATGFFLEFPGVNAKPMAWEGSAFRNLLVETPMGDLIRGLIGQATQQAGRAPNSLTPGEYLAIVEHIGRQGLVFGAPLYLDPSQPEYAVLVLRNAADPNVRGVFGKMIGAMRPADASMSVTPKSGRNLVLVSGGSLGAEGWSWWIEGSDLVFVFGPSSSTDEVLATLDGAGASAENEPFRQELWASEEGSAFQPLAIGAVRFDRPNISQQLRSLVDDQGIEQISLRWGFENEASVTIAQVDVPSPRKGFFTLFDQPTFTTSELPPLPAELESVTVLSIAPAVLFKQVVELMNQLGPGNGDNFADAAQAATNEVAALNLVQDVLSAMGPKIAFFMTPSETPTTTENRPANRPANPPGTNPLQLLNIDQLGLEQLALMIELQDADQFSSTLDTIIVAINRQIEVIMESVASAPNDQNTDPRAGRSGRGRNPGNRKEEEDELEIPKFELMIPNPKTYSLSLPKSLAFLASITDLRPTITLGQSHLIITMSPVSARLIREQEQDPSIPHWSPAPKVQEALRRVPTDLMLLSVNDPSQTIRALQGAVGSPRSPSNAPGGRSGRGGPRGRGGLGGRSGIQSGAGIDPSLIPSAEDLKQYLFPATYTVTVNNDGIRIDAYEAIPGQSNLSGLSTISDGSIFQSINPSNLEQMGLGSILGSSGAPE